MLVPDFDRSSICPCRLGKADPASAHVPLVKALRYLAYPCRPRSGLRMEVSAFHAQCTPSRFQHWGGSQARVVLQAGSCPSPWGYPLVPLSVPFALTLAGRRLVCRFGAPVPLHWSSARVPGWYVDDSLNFRTYLLTHARRVLRPTFAHVVLRLAGCCCRNCVATFRASSAGTRCAPSPEVLISRQEPVNSSRPQPVPIALAFVRYRYAPSN